ncbi:hypothetical protein TSAR_010623 [Trichomalopsis sarcophagae]|uniref:Uncharacterized protein n=1 Tax=Trichomalopsis sarcophagae TaxID=543379 RepID=A0A232ER36_9HYME|nr:hypothetical protein TSAR_010623 [Trichomalopsis sarcophagae]
MPPLEIISHNKNATPFNNITNDFQPPIHSTHKSPPDNQNVQAITDKAKLGTLNNFSHEEGIIITHTSREVTPEQSSKIAISSNSSIEEIINIAKKEINDAEKPNVVDKNLDHNPTYNSMTTVSDFLTNEESECGASDTSSENSESLGIPVSVFQAFDDFAYVPRQAEREQVAEYLSLGRFRVFDYEDHCANPHANLIRSDDIPPYPPVNCLFHSIIKTAKLNNAALGLRAELAQSPFLQNCGGPQKALKILQSEKPPWSIPENQVPALFTKLQKIPEHPFRYKENIIFLLTTDIFLETEILDAMLERGYINENILRSTGRNLGDVFITDFKGMKLFGLFIK